MPSKRGGGVGVLLLIFLLGLGRPAGAAPVVRIGVVIDGPWERNEEIEASFHREILDLTRGEFEVRFPEEKTILADWTVPGVRAALDRLLGDAEVDLVIAAGVLASNEVCRRGALPKPVVAPFVLNPRVQGIPIRDGTSGVKNLSFITFPADVRRDLAVFREVVDFDKVAMLHSPLIAEAIPELRENTMGVVGEMDLEMVFVPLTSPVERALDEIPADAGAVYVTPLLGMPPGAFERLVEGLIERKLPSFSVVGTEDVARGLLVGLTPSFDIPRLSRRLALHVQRILLGEDPSGFQVVFSRGERLTINMATARAIGVFPNWEVVTEADLLSQTRQEVDRQLTLLKAVREGVDANLDLATQARAVAAGRFEVDEARAPLLPQAEVFGTGVGVDGDMGSVLQPERSFTGAAGVSQVIFSERAWAGYRLQGHLQRAREQEHEQVRLDIVQEAATAYLNVLRAKTFERIQKENLKVTRSNLELARVRQSIGASGPGEVYRWESKIASDRKSAIEANAQRNLAEIALNRVLHRPLEEPFGTAEMGLDDPELMQAEGRLYPYFDNQWKFRVFRAFMVGEGLAAAPELRRLDAAIAAQERVLKSERLSFFSPTIAAQGEVSNWFARSGAGSAAPAPGGDRNWNVGLKLSLPLFSGGARVAGVGKAREEVRRLRLVRSAAAERVEQRIRSASHVMGASFAGIRLSKQAAGSARENLELVIDAYSRGVVSIIDLLDAQNAALVADQVAANAVYDFLQDLIEVERSAGGYVFLMDSAGAADFFERLDAFFARSSPDGP